MSATEIVQRLRGDQIDLRLDGDDVVINFPDGAVRPAVVDDVRANKAAIVAALRAEAVPSSGSRVRDLAIEMALASPAPALALKRLFGMTHSEFERVCRRVIKRPGPANASEDRAVVREILASRVGDRSSSGVSASTSFHQVPELQRGSES